MKQKIIQLSKTLLIFALFLAVQPIFAQEKSGLIVLQTDFGTKDGAVNAVKGVMYSVDKSLNITDLTNEIPAYNIWDAAYRLYQVASYWPKGTVFISVVDPGVGTKRHSVVAESKNGYYFVTPDNGTLTLINDNFGIKEIREIDETKNRLKGSNASYTFHGRDVYDYTAAKLAAGKIKFSEVGPIYKNPVTKLNYEKPYAKDQKLHGTIEVLDPQYGNLWTNINSDLVKKSEMKLGERYKVRIFHNQEKKFEGVMPYYHTFGQVAKGENLLYLNSLLNLAIGTNQENFSQQWGVSSGEGWRIEIERA